MMNEATRVPIALALCFLPSTFFGQQTKTYKHASEFQVAVLDENLRVTTGSDLTRSKNATDAKLSAGGQGIHLLHTNAGDFRVEAPVNKGATFLSAMGSSPYRPAQTIHNKWFLDNVQPGTKVLFASQCTKLNKKHPGDAVRCNFYFPDPDSSDHEYATIGAFTPALLSDGSNTQKTASTLCSTGKLKPEVEAELCGPLVSSSASVANAPAANAPAANAPAANAPAAIMPAQQP